MKKLIDKLSRKMEQMLNKTKLKLRSKLIIIFLTVKVIPIIILLVIALTQISYLGHILRDLAVHDSSEALNASAVENIERMTTDTAKAVAQFLYQRDADIQMLASLEPSNVNYQLFAEGRTGELTSRGRWGLSADGRSWEEMYPQVLIQPPGLSTNPENNDQVNGSSFHYREPEMFTYDSIPYYDEVAFLDLEGNQVYRYVTPNTTKINHPFSTVNQNVSVRENTYIKAEDYFEKLGKLSLGEIYVSDVIGAYVGSNYIGMYTPDVLMNDVADTHPNYELLGQIGKLPKDEFLEIAHDQAYAGMENPHGQRFEGIVRWATPVADENDEIIGYVTFALNHDHIMEFVDYITPMNERYTPLPNAYEGNYAFIWDYQSRSICHPRHHSIVGFDPETGERQVPWLETSLYNRWQEQADRLPYWWDFFDDYNIKTFDNQSREKTPAADLTAAGLVGLDGRYLNNAPQCTGWMDLTKGGGSGSFYIMWSGLYKLTTAGAIPYYTGQYAPSADNDYSRRGFGFVTIGAGLDDFTQAARDTEAKLVDTIDSNMRENTMRLVLVSSLIIVLVIFTAFVLASYLTNSIHTIINGISRFRRGERQFRLRSQASDELRTLADSFDEMADSIEKSVDDPLSIIDTDYKIIYMNQQALEVVGKTLDEAIGMPYYDVSLYPWNTVYCPITALQENHDTEVLYQEESGNYYKGHANYLHDKEGDTIGYIIVSNNVTEMEDARQKSELANVAKSNFLSNMSHEMRTPLNAIIGMTTIGLTDTDPEKKIYALNKIQDASTHLLGVINDVLDMSKIEASKFTLSYTDFVFEKMFRRVFDVIHFRIEEKQQVLTTHIDASIPGRIIADEQRLSQVILNLLTNAVKFTPNGGSIHIEATALEQNSKKCTIQISVTDTGIGISKEQQKRLFHAFEQAEASTSRKFGGTGLGLKISRSIVEMMDGNIWVESEPEKGSTFTFTICVDKGKHVPKKLLNDKLPLGKIKILAVDDDPHVLEFFTATAKRIGISCDVANNSKKALSLITESGPYSLHFIDWIMPEMDGIELARKIHEKTEQEIVIMMSAHNWSDLQEEARLAGVSKFLPKPLFVSSVVDCINEVLACETLDNAAQNLSEDDFSEATILLAEDVEINQEIILALLEPTGIHIDCANNGKEAVDMFLTNSAKYKMIFMDLQMPEMDGFQATRLIREGNVANALSIPIVAMTANVFKEDIEHCLEAGMNGHVGKPIQLEEVLEQLRKYL